MQPRIEQLREKKLVGKRMTMSLADNRTAELWKSFMPQLKYISKRLTDKLVSMTIYPPDYFNIFSTEKAFEKWATVEVSDFEKIQEGMEFFTLNSGLYVVFNYKGNSNDNSIFQYIFNIWLPASEYLIDSRPHFEVLGEKYKNSDPDSEEEIWIPIRKK